MSTPGNRCARIVLAGLALLGGGIAASALPLITNAVVTEGADAAELPPKFTGQTFNHGNEGANFVVPPFGEDVPVFNDRAHEWNGAGEELPIPAYLAGGEYLMFSNDDRDNSPYRVVVTLSEEADVYLLIDNRHPDGDNATPPEHRSHDALGDRRWLAAGEERVESKCRPGGSR